jgi:hypothetical protein
VDGHNKDLIVLASPYSLNLTPADYLLFQRVREELARICLSQGSLTKTWDGVIRIIAVDDFSVEYR